MQVVFSFFLVLLAKLFSSFLPTACSFQILFLKKKGFLNVLKYGISAEVALFCPSEPQEWLIVSSMGLKASVSSVRKEYPSTPSTCMYISLGSASGGIGNNFSTLFINIRAFLDVELDTLLAIHT